MELEHGPECRKWVEENRALRDRIDGLKLECQEATEENQAKDALLDEVLDGVQGLRKQMQAEIESFTRVCLQLEVQKFHSGTLQQLLREKGIDVPAEISELLHELEQVDNMDQSDTIVFEAEDEDDVDPREDSRFHNRSQQVDEYGRRVPAPGDHRKRVLAAILKRIDRSKNQEDKAVGGQSDLDSGDDEAAAEARHHQNKIATIIDQKSKSIADVLLNDGLHNFYGNFLRQQAHPFAKRQGGPLGSAG